MFSWVSCILIHRVFGQLQDSLRVFMSLEGKSLLLCLRDDLLAGVLHFLVLVVHLLPLALSLCTQAIWETIPMRNYERTHRRTAQNIFENYVTWREIRGADFEYIFRTRFRTFYKYFAGRRVQFLVWKMSSLSGPLRCSFPGLRTCPCSMHFRFDFGTFCGDPRLKSFCAGPAGSATWPTQAPTPSS